jgi:hypothetical protein
MIPLSLLVHHEKHFFWIRQVILEIFHKFSACLDRIIVSKTFIRALVDIFVDIGESVTGFFMPEEVMAIGENDPDGVVAIPYPISPGRALKAIHEQPIGFAVIEPDQHQDNRRSDFF